MDLWVERKQKDLMSICWNKFFILLYALHNIFFKILLKSSLFIESNFLFFKIIEYILRELTYYNIK